jgi:hypothetical protein
MYQTQTLPHPSHSLHAHAAYHSHTNGHPNGHQPNGHAADHRSAHNATGSDASVAGPSAAAAQAPAPAQAPRPRAPANLPQFDRVQVHGIPSVTSDGDRIVVGDGNTSPFFLPLFSTHCGSPASSPI